MSTETCYAAELTQAVDAWLEQGLPKPQVILVAGSGVAGDFGVQLVKPRDLNTILPFPATGIAGHALSYELLRAGAEETDPVVLCCRGRLHAYQGYSAHEVVFAVRFAALLGAKVAVITNASGGLYDGVEAGDLALITDHVNLTGRSPLLGDLPSAWGPQFPDMSQAYDGGLRSLAQTHATRLGIDLHEAIYLGVLGPSYETPAEIQAFKALGAGLVGMSTVLEVIAARHMGLRCLGLSLVTNPAAGVGGDAPLDHGDVLEIGRMAVNGVQRLIGSILADPDLLG